VTRERIYIETMQAVLTSTSKIMMDYRGAGNLLYLPLEKIMQGAGAASETPAPRATPPEAPTEAGPRSRETLRNRDRNERQ
jgi:modulator of FtsH protease HflK